MKLVRRFSVDNRDPDHTEDESQNLVNEKMVALQTNEKGERNEVEIIDIKETNKDSGIMHFLVLYEDKGLDTKQE